MTVTVNVERKGVEVNWEAGDSSDAVKVYAQGSDGRWHNTAEMPNDGHALLSYPADFEGDSLVEVRNAAGDVVDSGTISVG